MAQSGIDSGSPPEPAAVRWFHATRALPGTTFEEGLLPTVDVMPKLWNVLGVCAERWLTASEWAEYQRSFLQGDRRFSGQFRRKSTTKNWQGPFAFLVKDAALRRHDGQKDFTRICETLEDVCSDFAELYPHPLRAAYEELTRPCLVTFTWPGPRHGTVQAAANYVFRSLHGLTCGLDCNTNFDGGGNLVPRSFIDRVEWL